MTDAAISKKVSARRRRWVLLILVVLLIIVSALAWIHLDRGLWMTSTTSELRRRLAGTDRVEMEGGYLGDGTGRKAPSFVLRNEEAREFVDSLLLQEPNTRIISVVLGSPSYFCYFYRGKQRIAVIEITSGIDLVNLPWHRGRGFIFLFPRSQQYVEELLREHGYEQRAAANHPRGPRPALT